jgi:hypothetical protein
MSMQKAQPLIWLARSSTSSRVEAGRPELSSALPATMMCFSGYELWGVARATGAQPRTPSSVRYTLASIFHEVGCPTGGQVSEKCL